MLQRETDVSFLHANVITNVGDKRVEFVFDFSNSLQKCERVKSKCVSSNDDSNVISANSI